MHPHSYRRPIRTLVVINAESFGNKKYDLTFLERESKLMIHFFVQQEVRLWLDIRKDFNSSTFLLPDAEEDMHDFIIKAVLYEVGHRPIYRKVIFLDATPERLWPAVAFLRGKGIEADVMDLNGHRQEVGEDHDAEDEHGGHESESNEPTGKRKRGRPRAADKSHADTNTVERTVPRKGRRRRKVKLPTSPEYMQMVMRALLSNVKAGQVYTKTQISPIIHKETEMNVKDLFPYKNLTGLYRFLLSQDIIEELDKKRFRVLTTHWTMPEDAS